MEERKVHTRINVGRPAGEKRLGKPRYKRQDNIKVGPKEII
jgi:hypothetical protein